MGSNIADFLAGLDEYAAEVDENVAKMHRATALEALKGLVQMTPVDTGRARGAWTVRTNMDDAADFTFLAQTYEAEHDKSGGATIARGLAEIARAKPYTITSIGNGLDYIEELENGSSQQAPQGMLNVTANRLRAWLQRRR